MPITSGLELVKVWNVRAFRRRRPRQSPPLHNSARYCCLAALKSFLLGGRRCDAVAIEPLNRYGSTKSPDRPVNNEFTSVGTLMIPYVNAISSNTSGKNRTSTIAPSYGGG